MNIENYKLQMDNIKISEDFIDRTFRLIKQNPRPKITVSWGRVITAVSGLAACFILVFIFLGQNNNDIISDKLNETSEIQAVTGYEEQFEIAYDAYNDDAYYDEVEIAEEIWFEAFDEDVEYDSPPPMMSPPPMVRGVLPPIIEEEPNKPISNIKVYHIQDDDNPHYLIICEDEENDIIREYILTPEKYEELLVMFDSLFY